MHYQELVKNKRTSTQIEKDKLALVNLLVNKLEASGLAKENTDSEELLTAITSLANKIDAIEPQDNTSIIEAINNLANKETIVNYTAPEVVVPDFKVPEIKVPNVNIPDFNIPEIKVPKITIPKITVPSVDTTGIENVLREMHQETADLDDYMAQDLKEVEGKQYVGFVNPEGKWYIIENDTKGNTLRYLFGDSDYSSYFKKSNEYVYKLLNEAINEV